MDYKIQKQLKEYFLIFGAEQNFSEAEIEKLERIVHEFNPQDLATVKKICGFIAIERMMEKPEEEIVAAIKERNVL